MVARCKDGIADERVITIIARMLKSGVIQEGRWEPTSEGTPQGGPLSPLLSNIVLDQLDKELEARGHRFVRYADDFQIFTSTYRAAYRAGDRIESFLEKRMHLQVNRQKSGMVHFEEATFLGFRYGRPKEGGPQDARVYVSEKAKSRFKDRVRELTRRLARDYFFGGVMQWIRRRLRVIKLKQWGCRNAVRKALIRAGVTPRRAAKMALSQFGWRAACSPAAHQALPNRWFVRRGLHDLGAHGLAPGAN